MVPLRTQLVDFAGGVVTLSEKMAAQVELNAPME